VGRAHRAEGDPDRQGGILRYRRVDLNTASGLRLMKRNVAGAATVRSLAQAIMGCAAAHAPQGAAADRRKRGLRRAPVEVVRTPKG